MSSSSTSARALKWEFFLTRWQQAYEVVSGALGNAAAAAAGAPRLSPIEAARLDVLLAKAERARSALAQLREFDARHAALSARYGPLAASLPELRRRLRAGELDRLAEYGRGGGRADGEGGPLGEPLRQAMRMLEEGEEASGSRAATGAAAATTTPTPTTTPAGRSDRFGIRVAFRAEHPLGVLRSWAEYRSAFNRVSKAAGELLEGPNLGRLASFNRERRALLAEASSLRRQLVDAGACAPSEEAAAAAAAEAFENGGSTADGASTPPPPPPPPLPDLASVERDCAELEALTEALQRVRAAHAALIARGLAGVDLEALEARLALRMGAAAGGGGGRQQRGDEGSGAQAAIARLRALKAAVCGGGGGWGGGGGFREEEADAELKVDAEVAEAGWRASGLPHEAWEQLDADVATLAAVAARLRLRDEGRSGGGQQQQQQPQGTILVTVQDASDLNVARAQQALYERLSQLQRA
jgi:hypothetical protein